MVCVGGRPKVMVMDSLTGGWPKSRDPLPRCESPFGSGVTSWTETRYRDCRGQ